MSVDWLGYGYAALITIGGIVGYVKAGKDLVRGTNDGVLYCGLVLGYLEHVKHVLKYFKMNENVLAHFNRKAVAERMIYIFFNYPYNSPCMNFNEFT